MSDIKLTKENVEEMLINETKNITPNILSQIKMKAQEIKVEETVNEEIEEPKEKSRFSFKSLFSPMKLVITCVLIIAIVFTISGVNVYGKTVETITLDVNPSIELSLNKNDTVIKVNYNNEDAENVFKDLKIKNTKIDKAIETCYDALYNAGYLDDVETNMIVVSGHDEDDKDEDKNIDIISHICDLIDQKNKEHDVQCEVKPNSVNAELKEFAKEIEMPVGQARIVVEILIGDEEISLEELSNKTMKDLKKIYNEYKTNQEKKKNKEENEPSTGKPSTEEPITEEKTLKEKVEDMLKEAEEKRQEKIDEGISKKETFKEEAEEAAEELKEGIGSILDKIKGNSNKNNNSNKENGNNNGNNKDNGNESEGNDSSKKN